LAQAIIFYPLKFFINENYKSIHLEPAYNALINHKNKKENETEIKQNNSIGIL